MATTRDVALEYTRHWPRDVPAWASLANALTDLGLYSKARVALKRLETLGRDKASYSVRVSWGRYYNTIGDLKRAERWFLKAAEASPAAFVFVGGVVAKQGRLAEARRYHRQATRAPEDDRLARDEAHFNLGLIFRAERRYREAIVEFDRAIALDPKYSLAMKARADVQSALKVKAPKDHARHWRQMLDAMGPNPATCYELLRTYLKRYPDHFGGWLVFADVLAAFARYDEAFKALRQAERVAISERLNELPDDFFATQWGFLYRKKKDFRRAELAFRHAVALRPSARNLTSLAEVLIVEGQLTEARRHLQRAMRLGLDDPSTAHYQLALIARARGKYADALTNLDAAIRHSPDYPLAIVARRDVREAIKGMKEQAPSRAGQPTPRP